MSTTRKIITASMLAALTFVATVIIKIPSPLNGYINLGDALVLLTGYLLSPLYAFLSAGIGSALADLYSGYFIYAPITFIIKGVMAFVFSLTARSQRLVKKTMLAVICELIMIGGYYVFEGFLYGFIPSLVNVVPNMIQGIAGMIIGIMLISAFKKYKVIKKS
ncbi:MAG: ECF transporter S component [Clostridia bacterium]|nr:ECF transporter S component [Clostridia bacterium]